MTLSLQHRLCVIFFLMIGLIATGCGGSESSRSESGNAMTENGSDAGPATASEPGVQETSEPPALLPTIQLGESTPIPAADIAAGGDAAPQSVDDVLTAMKPLQIMLGIWEGKTRKPIDGFSAVDNPSWVWDFKTDPKQPALVLTSDASPYLKNGRLTYDVSRDVYRFTAVNPEGERRVYEGTYSEPPRREDVDGDKVPDQLFKLKLTEVSGPDVKQKWEIVFNQQENNRYLYEIYRARGGDKFYRFDTVAHQRDGTSFAKNDEDYGERTCIITQGLGTSQVSFEGKTYWVCCSGCKAEFEADPAKWIARYEKKKAEMAKQ